MTIAELVKKAHHNAVDKGFYDEPKKFAEIIALIHSEASEALEAFRDNLPISEMVYGDEKKPEGVPAELADIVIRVADACGYYEIDLDAAIKEKMKFNKTRPYKHGKVI